MFTHIQGVSRSLNDISTLYFLFFSRFNLSINRGTPCINTLFSFSGLYETFRSHFGRVDLLTGIDFLHQLDFNLVVFKGQIVGLTGLLSGLGPHRQRTLSIQQHVFRSLYIGRGLHYTAE